MKIAFNLWELKNKDRTGIGWFITYTLKILIHQHPDVEFVLFVAQNFEEREFEAPNVTYKRVFPNLRHPVLYIYYLDIVLPKHLKKTAPDLFVTPDGFLSLRTKTPQLAIIHDIHFVHLRNDVKWYNQLYFDYFFPRFAKKAIRIATDSEYSKKDIADTFKVQTEKIDVVYCGVNDYILRPVDKSLPNRFENIATDKPYFIFVGSINPRKNIARLIQAFEKFKESGRDAKLVIGGGKGWLFKEVDELYNASKWKADILFTGRLANNEVKYLMENALALSFVPYYEGFGIPILEAMVCNIPVVTATVTSLPEVAGNAAVYVDPFSVDSITGGLVKIFDDKQLALTMVEEGKERLKLFSWEKTSERLWKSIDKSIDK